MWNAAVVCCGVLLLVLLTAVGAMGMELYVAPDGNDAWSGWLPRPNAGGADGPVATLTGARDALRALRKGGARRGPVRIVVADGRYAMTGPLELSPEDGGAAAAPVIYEAAVPSSGAGARPVFSGGRAITGFRPAGGGLWRARVPDVAAGNWYFEQLFVNGRRAVRARSPSKFWFYLLDVQEDVLEKIARGVDRKVQELVEAQEELHGVHRPINKEVLSEKERSL